MDLAPQMAGGETEEMACRELVELVTDYLEGTLPDNDRLLLEAHVAACPYCEEYIAEMRRTIETLGRLPAEIVDPSRRKRLLEAFRDWRGNAA